MEDISILLMISTIIIGIIYLLKHLFRSDVNFNNRALSFAKFLSNNKKNSKYSLSFKDVFFLSLEDYLKYYYALNSSSKASIRNYLVEHFDNITHDGKSNIEELTKEILIGHFMKKKTYATGKSWILVSQHDLSYLNNAVAKAYKTYPLDKF